MSEKITRENRELKFETLQLHVGQESPDPVTAVSYTHLDVYKRQDLH